MDQTLLESNQDIVLFHVSTKIFALSIDYVTEVILPLQVNKLPLSSNVIEGLINVRGSIYPLVNLSKLFGLETSETNQDDERVILVNLNDTSFAFKIDCIEALTSYTPSQLQSDVDMEDEQVDLYTEGIIHFSEQQTAYLLELHALIDSLKEEAIHLATS